MFTVALQDTLLILYLQNWDSKSMLSSATLSALCYLRPNNRDSQARRQAPPAPTPLLHTLLPCPASSLVGFPICSRLVFGGEEIIRDIAAYMQEHVWDAAIHRRSLHARACAGCSDTQTQVCVRRSVWWQSSIGPQDRVPGEQQVPASTALGPALGGLGHTKPDKVSLVFQRRLLSRATCYCLCHHKFKKGKLIKYGARLRNIF